MPTRKFSELRKSMARPAIGDIRFIVEWIDRELMNEQNPDDDLADRLDYAECRRTFPTEGLAKAWAVENAAKDEYGSPRCQKRTWTQTGDDGYCEWETDWTREWDCTGVWQDVEA